MVPTFVGNVGIFGIYMFVAYFTGISHIEMFSMRTFNVVLHSMQLVAILATNQTNVSNSNVTSDKILKLLISFYKMKKT
jgi:hypothetical protein